MDKSSTAVCYAFLKKLTPERQRLLATHLPSEQAQAFAHAPALQGDPLHGLASLEEELFHVHFSWLAPFLRALPEGDIKLFLGCLTENQQKGLKAALLFSNHIPVLSDLGKQFLRRQLFASLIEGEELLPISCLPATSMNMLLALTFEELRSMIDLLAMHDLAVEIRQIIDTTKLRRIYSALSNAQTNFLKTLMYRKEPVIFKKMELNRWDGHTEALLHILEQRGINRLAKALFPEDPSLLWYVSRRLDSERGETLSKLCTSLDHPRAALLLSEQITDLIQSLKQG